MKEFIKYRRLYKEYKIYKKMYLELFNSVTDALELMESKPEWARLKLMIAQYACEEMFIRADPKKVKARKKAREAEEGYSPLAIYF